GSPTASQHLEGQGRIRREGARPRATLQRELQEVRGRCLRLRARRRAEGRLTGANVPKRKGRPPQTKIKKAATRMCGRPFSSNRGRRLRIRSRTESYAWCR